MKFKGDRPFAAPEAAERKLLQLANAIEADHAGRLSVSVINRQFRDAGGSYKEYGAAVKAAIAHGWLTMHPSGGPEEWRFDGASVVHISHVLRKGFGPRAIILLRIDWHSCLIGALLW